MHVFINENYHFYFFDSLSADHLNSPHTADQFCNLNLRTKKRGEIDLLDRTHFYDQDSDLSVCPCSLAVAYKKTHTFFEHKAMILVRSSTAADIHVLTI
jgi:hypothetical protein